MPYEGSYNWRMRQQIGSDLLLVPGAIVLLIREDGAILFTRRTYNGVWCLPGGGAEEGSSFARTAVTELREETGVVVDPADLVPFACLSEAELHSVTYPGGDVNHWFAMLFFARRWEGEPEPDGDETSEMLWADPASLPSPLEPPHSLAIKFLRAYLRDGEFQVS
ncbi:MAG TPA: NUDIX domain-containing protein [Solirubrobacterales bacterium]|jgi:8-oxo-dGTP pyrophosphatase MutT (NUDIX family)|nr:NUDIX domain-containing protein [Solirubrobacterales bacterium]